MNPNGTINWFPGHMAKSKNSIKENIKLVDVVAEVIDARIPLNSRTPDIIRFAINKPLILVLNKSDLADKKSTDEWIKYYKSKDIIAISMDCNLGKGLYEFKEAIRNSVRDKIILWGAKGIKDKPIKVMIVGQPNTGKSSLINRLAKRCKAKTENRPGVTRLVQWLTVGDGIELLDTPGILPTKIHSRIGQENLAFTGAIKDDILDLEYMAVRLLSILCKEYPERVKMRYEIEYKKIETLSGYEILELIGKKRGFLISGGEVDLNRTSKMFISEFRAGKIGGITLEKVNNSNELMC